jgi:hypothetical protein
MAGGRFAAPRSFPSSYTLVVNQEAEDDDLEPEYDFTGVVRGKYYERYQDGSNVVLLDPDVAQVLSPDGE